MTRRKQKVHEGKRCPYCGERMVAGRSDHRRFPTKDHLNPRALGGGPAIIVCRECNNQKGCMPLGDWIKFLIADRPEQVAPTVAQLRRVSFALFVPKDSELRRVLKQAQTFTA